MKKRSKLKKGLAILLSLAMVVGLMPGAGTMKVSAEESEASAEGYDADGFCMSYELTNGTWALKSDATECATHGDTCNGYQPAVEEQLEYDISGDGTTDGNDKAYKITNAGQLYWFADKVNNENATYNNINAVLTNDITVNEGVLSDGSLNTTNEGKFRRWTLIGYFDSGTRTDYFYSGIFDGQGYTISGLYFKDDNKSEVGLFGVNKGTIKKVNVTNSYFYGQRLVGGVCGYNTGTIEDSKNIDSFVKSEGDYAGGVCGLNYGCTITNCYNTGEVQGASYVGGVCGALISGSVKNCSNCGNVIGTGNNVGGICGYASSSLETSYNTGNVQGASYVGGVCGKTYSSSSSIKNCYYITKEENSIAAIGKDGGGYKIYVEGKTSEEFSNGMVAYLLNSRAAEGSPVWYQNIDNVATLDTAPVLDSSHGTVYASKPCPAKCSNTGNEVLTESQAHVFGEDNICTVCGAKGEIIDDSTLIKDKPEQDDAGVYQLETERQFYYFVALVNGRLAGVPQDTSASAVLKTDITVNDKVLDEDGNLVSETGNLKTWVPIGYSDGVRVQTYTGTFDGGGHTISGLYFDDTSISYVGLFGNSTGTIKNVKVADSYFKGNTYVGGVCGKNEGNIEGCEASGKVEANNKYADIGGICGYNGTGYVKNCKSAVDISHPIHFTYPNGGGIVGQNDGIIENCHNIGNVDLRYTNRGSTAGGICGKNNTGGTIKNSYNIGIITGDDFTGKICGINNGSVTNCYYQDSSESDSIAGTTFKTADQFAGGEVAYLLNEGKTDNDVVWRQTLTGEKDTIPVLDSGHGIVYASKPCESDFANTKFAEEKKHTVTMSEDGTSHTCSVCNKTEKHADVATFTVDEANHSITATCPSDCDLGTIRLSASDATYDGTDKAASTSGEIKGFTTPDIVYEKKADNGSGNVSFEAISSVPKDAGTYRASITYTVDADNSKVYTVSTEYTIARRPVTIKADNMSKIYGEMEPALSYKVSDDTPLVDDEELKGTLSREAGEDAGTYKITQGTVTNDTNPNYDITFSEGTFTINKAQTWGTADCVMNLVYDESSKSYTATITKVDGAEYCFGESGEWSTENTLTGIAHDTEVTGYIRIAGDKNHNPGAEASMTLTSGHGTLTHVEAKVHDCENAGNQEYWYCESCKKCFSDEDGETEISKEDVTIPATNHNWNQENYELDATHHWHNCQNENCPITDNSQKDGYGEHVDSDNNGICDNCNKLIHSIVREVSATLDGDIGLNYYIALPESVTADTGAYVQFTVNGQNTKVYVKDVTDIDGSVYKFTCWLTAKEMRDNVTFKLYDGKGTLIDIYSNSGDKVEGASFDYTLETYLKTLSSDENAALKYLADATLVYGAYAQNAFNHNADPNLDGSDLEDVTLGTLETNKMIKTGDIPEGLKLTEMTLILETETTLRLYFKSDNIENYTFKLDSTGVTLNKIEEEGLYYVEIANISAKDLDTKYTLIINDNCELTFNALSYAYATVKAGTNENICNVVKALYKYNDAANAYFGE